MAVDADTALRWEAEDVRRKTASALGVELHEVGVRIEQDAGRTDVTIIVTPGVVAV